MASLQVGARQQDVGDISPAVAALSRPGRKIRASITTRLVGNLQRQSQAQSSWVSAMLFLDSDPGFEHLRKTLVDRLLVMPRFRAQMKGRSLPIPQKFHFKEIHLADFDVDYHVRQVLHEGEPVSEADVVHYVEHMFNGWAPDTSKPLWQIDYVPRLEDGRACLITKISHAIADGVSAVEVLMRMLDAPADEAEAEAHRALAPPKKRRNKKAFGPLTSARIFMGGVWKGFFSPFTRPDPSNSLRPADTSKATAERRFAFTEKISLDRIKEVKSKLEGATVNDVLMTVLTLTIRSYFEEAEEKKVLRGSKLTAQFPISTRGRDEEAFRNGDPRNKWAYGSIALRNKEASAVDLFWKIKRDLDMVKRSPAPFVQTRVAQMLIPVLPLKMLNDTAKRAANTSTAQISSVAGPSAKCTVAGVTITDMAFILFSPLAFYLGMLSFDGQVSASVCLEASLNVDPKLIAKHWGPQFEILYAEVMAHDDVIPARRACLDCL